MRDALSLLDQAIAHGAGKVEEAPVRDMLGTVDLDHLFSVLDALLAGDVAGMLRVAGNMAARSLSFSVALQELASLMTRLQVAQFAPQAVSEDWPERARLIDLAKRFDPEYVQLAYQIAVTGRNELPLAPDEWDGFTMTLLRLYAFRPARADDAAHRGSPASDGKNDGARPDDRPPPATAAATARQAGAEAAPAPAGESMAKPTPEETGAPPAEDLLAQVAATPAASPAAGESTDWHALLAALNPGGMTRELGQHCELKSLDGERVVLCLSPTHRHLQIKNAQDRLQQALSEHFGRPMRLSIELRETSGETPAAVGRRQRQERQEQAVASVEQDAFVREVIDLFDATLIESSIKPVQPPPLPRKTP
jgi:DNA polymerase-3 subunit gamma/tau